MAIDEKSVIFLGQVFSYKPNVDFVFVYHTIQSPTHKGGNMLYASIAIELICKSM